MIKVNSKKIRKGDTFIAIKGVDKDGHDYINEAIKNGASKIVCEHGSYDADTILVDNTREYLSNYLHHKYGYIFEKIKLIGITGTNGKTTSAYFTYQLLLNMGVNTAYIGTIGFYINNKVKKTNNTTPDLFDLYKMFTECYNKGINVIVMEVSSHSLTIGRCSGLKFDITAFTNITQDHLDVHKNFENYIKAKQILFTMNKSCTPSIINADDVNYKHFMINSNTITYGINGNEYKLLNYTNSINFSSFSIMYNNKIYKINKEFYGLYNIYNYILALAISNQFTNNLDKLIQIKLDMPPGRFETIKHNSNIIIIDYAHTPDGIKKILNTVREFKKGRIITLFGCRGNRDKSKRKIMGNYASKLSDYVFITTDNSNNESNESIAKDILVGIKKDNYEIIHNRKKAIKKAFNMLVENDILLLLGKGPETYQVINGKKVPHNDKKEINKLITNSY